MKMYTEKPHRKKTKAPAIIILTLIICGIIAIAYWPGGKDSADQTNQQDPQASSDQQPDANTPVVRREPAAPTSPVKTAPTRTAPPKAAPKASPNPPKTATIKRSHPKAVYGPKGMTAELAKQIGPSPITVQPISKAKAAASVREGMKLFAENKNLIRARTLLNQAYTSGHLPEPQAVSVRKALESLANRTVLMKNPFVNPKDPYVISHKFGPGESLHSKRNRATGKVVELGIIARYKLNVPWRAITMLNGFGMNSTKFRAGQNYKLPVGPFHVVVYKSKCVADIYLRDLFLKRVPISTGKAETPTPEGYFRVLCWTGKTAHSTYYPPADSGMDCIPTRPGDKDYPLGPKGYNIKIEGIPELGTGILASQSYALHGTNEPAILGQPASRGCIRLGDKDIEFLYATLMDYADPTNKKVTWNRWSTITIYP